MPFDISLILESLLAVLLATTLIYCVVLEGRLRALRKDQHGLIATIGTLNRSIAGAEASIGALRGAANDASEELAGKLAPARALIDELSVLLASGERIAQRIAGARPDAAPAPRPALRTQSIADGLRAAR